MGLRNSPLAPGLRSTDGKTSMSGTRMSRIWGGEGKMREGERQRGLRVRARIEGGWNRLGRVTAGAERVERVAREPNEGQRRKTKTKGRDNRRKRAKERADELEGGGKLLSQGGRG